MPDFWLPIKHQPTQREIILFIPSVHRIDPSKLKELIAKGTEEIEAEARARGQKPKPSYPKSEIALAIRDLNRFHDRKAANGGRRRYH